MIKRFYIKTASVTALEALHVFIQQNFLEHGSLFQALGPQQCLHTPPPQPQGYRELLLAPLLKRGNHAEVWVT